MDWSPLWISLKIAALSSVITLILALLTAKKITEMKKGKFLADSILSLPLVLPPTVVGFFLLTAFGKNSALGRLLAGAGIRLVFSWQGAVLAAVIVSFPIMYRTLRGSFEQIDEELVDAAKLLGSGRLGILFHVWIPLSWQGIASGFTLSFARALGEFGATIMIAGNIPGKTRTMSLEVYTAVQSGNRELAYRWTIVILILSLLSLLCLNIWTGKQYRKE